MPKYSKAALKHIAKVLETAKNCPHPRNMRKQIGFGIFCNLCQCRVGLVSKEEGEKLILDRFKGLPNVQD